MVDTKNVENKFIQFCVIAEIEGNVNADEVVGQRSTIKKFVSKEGIYPFVSSRAIKKGIRAALEEKGYKIDPFHTRYGDQRGDSGNFVEYVDQDLFGYMIPADTPVRRKSPVEISYLVSIFPVPITIEFAGRFPKGLDPQPFEIEQAKFVGKFYGNIYNYVGIIHEKEMNEEMKKELKVKEKSETRQPYYEVEDRIKRLKDLLEIILLGNFKLPRSTNQLNQGSYRYVIVSFMKSLKPLPAFVTVRYQKEREYEIVKREENRRVIERVIEKSSEGYILDLEKIEEFVRFLEDGEEIFVVDFVGNLSSYQPRSNKKLNIIKPSEVKSEIIEKLQERINMEKLDYYLNYYRDFGPQETEN